MNSPHTKKRKRYYDFDDEKHLCQQNGKAEDAIQSLASIANDQCALRQLSRAHAHLCLASFYGQEAFSFLKFLAMHIPVEFPNRNHTIKIIMEQCFPGCAINDSHFCILDTSTSKENLLMHDSSHDSRLWEAAKSLGIPCFGFLLPDIEECMNCHSRKLYSASNSVTTITVHTIRGPRPCTKASLRCRDCGAWHGLTSYTVSGLKFLYPHNLCQFLVRASNRVYVTSDVHELLCQSRYVHKYYEY